MKVRCCHCDWLGDEKDLFVDDDGIEYCPVCDREGCLMDVEEEKE